MGTKLSAWDALGGLYILVLKRARRGWLLAPRKSQNKFTFGVEIKFVSAFWSPRAGFVLKTHGIYHKHTLPHTKAVSWADN